MGRSTFSARFQIPTPEHFRSSQADAAILPRRSSMPVAFICIRIYIYIYIYIYMCVHVRIRTCIYMYPFMFRLVLVFRFVSHVMHTSVCIYIYINQIAPHLQPFKSPPCLCATTGLSINKGKVTAKGEHMPGRPARLTLESVVPECSSSGLGSCPVSFSSNPPNGLHRISQTRLWRPEPDYGEQSRRRLISVKQCDLRTPEGTGWAVPT